MHITSGMFSANAATRNHEPTDLSALASIAQYN